MRSIGWLLLLAVGLTQRVNTQTSEEALDEEQYARQLLELANGQGFINRVFNQVVSSLEDFFNPGDPIDRQGVVGLLLPFLGLAIAAAIGVAVAVAVTNFVTDVIASGRGLTSDDWEISHSAWLEQLQHDLEFSWASV